MGDVSSGHESSGWIVEWLKYLIGGTWVTGGAALGFMYRWIDRSNDRLTEMIQKVESDSRDADKELLVQIREVGQAAVKSLQDAVREGDEGRRRIYERLDRMDGQNGDQRESNAHTYATKADLAAQTQQIIGAITHRGPVKDKH